VSNPAKSRIRTHLKTLFPLSWLAFFFFFFTELESRNKYCECEYHNLFFPLPTKMEDPIPKLLTIAELLHRNHPLTATSSLHSPLPGRPISPKPPSPPGPTHSNANPKILTPLNYPAILIGTLTLPIHASPSDPNPNLPCPYNNCFRFSDDTAAICCDVLDFDVRIIGKKIRVLSWNFIPLKPGGGFLEIIKWSFPESTARLGRCSNVDTFPLVSGSSSTREDDSKARYRIHGALESVSPVNVVPCNKGLNSSASVNLRGFLLRVMVCECKLCSSKSSVIVSSSHSYNKPVFVYFCGAASSWHSVITKLIGKIVTVSGLKKKLVYIGKEESRLMYVTAEKSALHLPRLSKKWVPCEKRVIEGKGECGSYKGIIRGMYMNGMVMELDNEVWLLLTDHLVTPPHSLRVGALVSEKNSMFF
jgi:hypothetical protein